MILLSSWKETFYPKNNHWLTRIVFLRAIAFIYGVAFTVALCQNRDLLGSNGLLPVSLHLKHIRKHIDRNSFSVPSTQNIWSYFFTAPTLLWFINMADIDLWLDLIALCGIVLSSSVLITGSSSMVIMFTLWVLYQSIVNVGQTWYSFGWESQLLETGFLAIFLCPLVSLKQLPSKSPPSLVVVLGYRWLLFRIMLGAGLIKIRGDQCWRDLTCMNYHYETQPVPNPISYYLHQSPSTVHKAETLFNHVVELIVPFFILLPSPFPALCGILQIVFMATLVVSGNLSFLNWLTMLPAIFCLNDSWFKCLFSKNKLVKLTKLIELSRTQSNSYLQLIRTSLHLALAALLFYLSIPIVQNLLSSRQIMNTSFDSFRIMNTYGAFGSVTKTRTEIIIEGSWDSNKWYEYEFKCKPGNLTRAPCQISPYHYRLDWLMWFAAFQNYQQNPWLIHLIGKILTGDDVIRNLMAEPFPPFNTPPRLIRAKHYEYRFTDLTSKEAASGQWWRRKYLREYLPPVSMESLKPIYEQMEWDYTIAKK